MQAMRATTNLLAVAEKKWIKLQHLAALHLHARTSTLHAAEMRADASGKGCADSQQQGGPPRAETIVVRGFEAEGKHRFALEQMLLGCQKMVKVCDSVNTAVAMGLL
jgi:hypothetical protein